MTKEPRITVNGITLTDGEAMTIRVALEAFRSDLIKHGLGNDAHEARMVTAYTSAIVMIYAAMAEEITNDDRS